MHTDDKLSSLVFIFNLYLIRKGVWLCLIKQSQISLNEQINLEFYSSNVYLQMSSWCSKHGYEGAAAFLLRHADEELEHMQKLFKYVSETSGMPLLGKIDAPKNDYKSLKRSI